MLVRLGSLLTIVAVACSGTSKDDAPFGAEKGGTGGTGVGAEGGSVTPWAGRGGSSGAAAGRTGVGGASGGSGAPQGHAGTGGTTAGTGSGASGGSSGGSSGGMSAAGRSDGGRGAVGSGGDGATSSGATGGSSGEAGGSAGGSGGKGGTGGTGSTVGGAGPMPGFSCYSDATCKTGERCVDCNKGEIATGLCAPDPDSDPSGYQAATASCLTVGTSYTNCDGPEDCAQGDYCVYGSTPQNFGAKCQSEPAPEPARCCFSCDAVPVCTLCWNDDECPVGYLCIASPGAPNDVGGCRVAD